MKRIYFGTLTIDTTDELADTVLLLAESALSGTRTRSQNVAPGQFASQP